MGTEVRGQGARVSRQDLVIAAQETARRRLGVLASLRHTPTMPATHSGLWLAPRQLRHRTGRCVRYRRRYSAQIDEPGERCFVSPCVTCTVSSRDAHTVRSCRWAIGHHVAQPVGPASRRRCRVPTQVGRVATVERARPPRDVGWTSEGTTFEPDRPVSGWFALAGLRRRVGSLEVPGVWGSREPSAGVTPTVRENWMKILPVHPY